MTGLLIASALLISALTLYSLAHYFCAAVFLFSRQKQRAFSDASDAVSVLVPARNEGESALRAIVSLLEQDHKGPTTVYLLIKDRSDSCIEILAKQHPGICFDVPAPARIELPEEEGRCTVIMYTGLDPKSDKVNWMTAQVTTPYLAILDADHQARPDWLRTSLCLLHEKKARIIQGTRGPLVAHGFFPLWDSLHQHIGCEVFNNAFSKMGLPVFFTGTTAVMETELLQTNPLNACLTEDAYFSYTLLKQGIRIIHNPHSGSDEETSPDLYSFLARRRRWANGHTQAFFDHISILWDSPLKIRERLQFLLHGVHYLVSIAVLALHVVIGLIFASEIAPLSACAAAVASLMLAFAVARTQPTEVGPRPFRQRLGTMVRRGAALTVLFTWLAPVVFIAMNLAQAVITDDPSRTLLPGPQLFHAIGLIGLCAPVVVLLAGLVGMRQLGVGSFVAVVVTYLLAFYLDLCGVLLGIVDRITGGAKWQVVRRASALPTAEARGSAALIVPLDLKQSWRVKRILESTQQAVTRSSSSEAR
tara:strand:+ start:27807 stop:29405 length:1599 start_codon:yes stop_codon:yes gene_type:complete